MEHGRKLRTLVASLAIGAGVACAPAGAGVMYAANNDASDNMYAIDIGTQTASLLGAAGVNLDFGGLGFGLDGTLYGWTTTTRQLYTVSTSNGAWTLVGGAGTTICGDTFDISPTTGVGYVTNVCNQQLSTVDLGTGNTTPGASLSNWATGAGSAFGPGGSLYYIDAGGGQIRETNVTTGATAILGATGIATTLTNLAYDPDDDMLYAVGLDNAHLYRFDSTTGAGADLGVIAGLPTGGQMTMSTIRVGAVPEPATLALVGLALSGLAVSRRRRK